VTVAPWRLDKTAKELMSHAVSMGLTFCLLVLVAIGIEAFSRLMVYLHWVGPGSYQFWAMYIAARAIAGVDVVTLVAVVIRKAWKVFKAV
jgi:hypothetical protein